MEIGQKVTWLNFGNGNSETWYIGKITSIGKVNIKVERLRSGRYSYDPPRFLRKKKEHLKLL